MNATRMQLCRALCSADGLNPDQVVIPSPPAVTGIFQWQQYVPKVELMLNILSVPTAAMLAAVTTNSATPTQVWQAMLGVVNS